MRDFQHTVNVLVQAYLNNTLAHGLCSACAVGNIVADSLRTSPAKNERYPVARTPFHCYVFSSGQEVLWSGLFITRVDGIQYLLENPSQEAYEQAERTGYTVEELAKIEFAFETAPRECSYHDHLNDEWMFRGLMAVVDVLAEIHGIDLTEKESAKALFVKA